jgi:four helix bundle protein
MFDFEKLTVYQKAREFNSIIRFQLIGSKAVDPIVKNQLNRAALSIMLNIAEGSGRFTNPDKKNFYVIARGSLFECIAITSCLLDQQMIGRLEYTEVYSLAEEISKMLFTLIRGLE